MKVGYFNVVCVANIKRFIFNQFCSLFQGAGQVAKHLLKLTDFKLRIYISTF